MSEKFVKGALVQFMPVFGLPVPNVVVFQFNPETMSHEWKQPEAVESEGGGAGHATGNPLAVKGVPGESFSFTLNVDSVETIADGAATAPIAQVSGAYTRLAALEMLLHPVPADPAAGLVGAVSAAGGAGAVGASIGGAATAVSTPVPQSQVPTVLFVWGPGRIVPVRVTELTITEQLYDGLLNPTHAEAKLSLRVLTPAELAYVTGPLKQLAKGAYAYSHALRQALAIANLANAAESIVGMLPV
ncbi:MAG TPA: hypothetical protein VHF47_09015 [Acidimicrobiales bacterium]|nr:hypothetical protein [Acidimicrobiales bacterium]